MSYDDSFKTFWPKIGDKLFFTDSDWWHNACLNLASGWGLYASGYKKGADILVQHVLDHRKDQDTLIYPIVFLYRQFIELKLKEIISDGSKLFDKPIKIPANHSIFGLWNICQSMIEEVWSEGDKSVLEAVKQCIEEFSEIDPKSMSFRYPVDTKGNPSLPAELHHINIRKLGEVMQKLNNLLDGCATALSVYLDHKMEIESYHDY